jgi:cell division septal protein FtsQ
MKKILWVFIVILIITGLVLFINNKKFFISEIIINNNHFVAKEKIERFTNPLKNHNFFIALTRSFFVKPKILKSFKQIENVKFNFDFPAKIKVTIFEQKPWGMFLIPEKNIFISVDGTILNSGDDPVTIDEADKIVIIKGIKSNIFQNNTINAKLFEKIKQIQSLISQYFLDKNLHLYFEAENNLILLKNDAIPIIIGEMDQLEQKFKNLNNYFLYVKPDESKIEYIDLRVTNKVVVKYDKSYENQR